MITYLGFFHLKGKVVLHNFPFCAVGVGILLLSSDVIKAHLTFLLY